MPTLLLIGMGPGDPDQITLQAVKALNRANVIFLPDKGSEKQALRAQRMAICARHLTNPACRFVEFAVPRRGQDAGYETDVAAWHAELAALYAALFARELGDKDCGAFLVWGDPTLYDSTLRIIEQVRAQAKAPLDYEIIPGVTSVQALAARHRIPLNDIGGSVRITTGRRLETAMLEDANVVVMLDGQQAFQAVEQQTEIHWGAYLGLPEEMLMSGRLADVGAGIAAARAKARAANGWIMDTYILRQPKPRGPG